MQMGHPATTRTLAQELRATDAFIPDDFNQLGVLSLAPSSDPALLGVQ